MTAQSNKFAKTKKGRRDYWFYALQTCFRGNFSLQVPNRWRICRFTLGITIRKIACPPNYVALHNALCLSQHQMTYWLFKDDSRSPQLFK